MANINCPVIGTWNNGSGGSLTFNTDGTLNTTGIVEDDPQYSFLVWKMDSDQKLVTLDDSGNVVVYYVLTASSLQLSNAGELAGTYSGTLAPEPLVLSNDLLGGWTAVVTGGHPAGNWALLYTPEGIVALEHASMGHSFTCAYLVRDIAGVHTLVTYGQMRFASPITATFPTPSGSPLTTTVTETQGITPLSTWVYTASP